MAHIVFPATVIKTELQEMYKNATKKQVYVRVFRVNSDVVFDVNPRLNVNDLNWLPIMHFVFIIIPEAVLNKPCHVCGEVTYVISNCQSQIKQLFE